MRLRIDVRFVVGARTRPLKLPLNVRIRGSDGVVLEGIVHLKTDLQGTAPEQQKHKSTITPVFAIAEGGEYKIEIALAPEAPQYAIDDPGISSVNASVVGNVAQVDDQYQLPGGVMIVLGIYILARSRRRRKIPAKKQTGNRSRPAAKNKSRWGRQGHSR